MIQFRCWYCLKRYKMAESRIGDHFVCTCKSPLRIPKRDGGDCRVKMPWDWVVEIIVYGGGGAVLGFGLAVLILAQLRFGGLYVIGMPFTAGLTLMGFLFGLFGGERGINWVGRVIREREEQ
jgi:hypothetical protein